VPCSFLTPLINCAISRHDVRYVGAANEGDAVAIASGSAIGGRPAVAMMQNSGLGNAVNPLNSLNAVFHIPVLLIVTHRGDPDGVRDEPQHTHMGRTTGSLLDLLDIPWTVLPAEPERAVAVLRGAVAEMNRRSLPVALVVKKGTFAERTLRPASSAPLLSGWPPHVAAARSGDRPSRREVVGAVVRAADADRDIIVATTGFTGRVLHEAGDRHGQLALVGSMGCAAPFALGLAIAQPARRVIVLDGDGAVLMRMGALATIGHERPANLVHVCLDNEVHDSTGGQATVSSTADLGNIARACGYLVERVSSTEAVTALVARPARPGPVFIHIKTAPGESGGLSRPGIAPADAARRLRDHLRA
jgi:phosphonopyruvate decarboxylase